MFQFGEGAFVPQGIALSRTLLTTFPDDINNAAWSKGNSTVTTGRSDPYGGTAAEGMYETTANSASHQIGQGFASVVSGTVYLQEAIVKPIGVGRVLFFRTFSNGFASATDAWFDVPNKRVGRVQSYGNLVPYGADLVPFGGNGYVRCRLYFKALANESTDGCFFITQTADGSEAAFIGDVTKGYDFYRAAMYSVP